MRKSLGLALLLVAGTGGPVFAQETGAGGGGPLTVDGGLVIWTLVVFGLLLYVLKRNVWRVRARKSTKRRRRPCWRCGGRPWTSRSPPRRSCSTRISTPKRTAGW